MELLLIFAYIDVPVKKKPVYSVQQSSAASTHSKVNQGSSKHKLWEKRQQQLKYFICMPCFFNPSLALPSTFGS